MEIEGDTGSLWLGFAGVTWGIPIVVCLCKQLWAQQCVFPIVFSRYLLTACVYFMGGQMESFCPGVAWAGPWAMPDLKQTAGGPSVWLGKWLLAKLSRPTVCEHGQQGVVVGTIHTDSDVWATEGWLWSFLAPATWWVEELGSSMLSLHFFHPSLQIEGQALWTTVTLCPPRANPTVPSQPFLFIFALWIAMTMERGDYNRAKLEAWDFSQILKALLPRSPLPELCEKKLNNRRMQIARFTKTIAFLKSLRDPWEGGAVCLMPTRLLLVNLKCFLPTVCLLRANLN